MNRYDQQTGCLVPAANNLPAMADKLRQAMFDGIKESDIKDIVANLVEKAKKGDKTALKFIFDYMLAVPRPDTAVQVNVNGRSRGARR